MHFSLPHGLKLGIKPLAFSLITLASHTALASTWTYHCDPHETAPTSYNGIVLQCQHVTNGVLPPPPQ